MSERSFEYYLGVLVLAIAGAVTMIVAYTVLETFADLLGW
jgi:hypothetical protein